ncbi:MAG: citrate lyase acyl carrier protein [Deferribacteraceae bacterium]|nr:citrate lyase acyl carrier protein [Deferribacteraceae bacterium]
MEIKAKSFAGTLESSDVFVEVSPNSGRKINLESVVLAQFGDDITRVVNEVLDSFKVDNIAITLKDRGALECTIRARVETAIRRQEGK